MSGSRLPPVGFWSYARQDDELSGGKLSQLRAHLSRDLQQLLGRERVRIFQDARAIRHGRAWETEICKAIGESNFFIPIVTPNFIQSKWCAREVALFGEREEAIAALLPDIAGQSRVFPIFLVDIEGIEPEEPAILERLQKLQWFDFRRFRHRSFDDPAVREALSELAESMRDLLRLKTGSPTTMTAEGAEGTDAAQAAATFIVGGEERSKQPNAAAPAQPTVQTAPRPVGVGDRLNGIFEIRRFVKAGGMGQVFEGWNINTGERVAIKTLLPDRVADAKLVELFKREALTLTRLHHEALVQYRVFAHEQAFGLFYMVTEYIDGIDLGEFLQRSSDLTERQFAGLLRRLAEGLGAAHEMGAVHRDISPENVMLPGGDLSRAKIIDFGIAKDLGESQPTLIGDRFAGKLAFAAPEQFGDHGGKIGPWSDVYSLGLVLLAVARRAAADMGGSFADAVRKRRELPDLAAVPVGLRPVLSAMLQPDPQIRLRQMADVLERLGEAERPAAPAPVPLAEEVAGWIGETGDMEPAAPMSFASTGQPWVPAADEYSPPAADGFSLPLWATLKWVAAAVVAVIAILLIAQPWQREPAVPRDGPAAPREGPAAPREGSYAWATSRAVLGANPEFLEARMGPARERGVWYMVFTVEGCDVGYIVEGTQVRALEAVVSESCRPSLAGTPAASVQVGPATSFGDLQQVLRTPRLFAPCIADCGNAAAPRIQLIEGGSRADNFVEVVFSTSAGDDGALLLNWADDVRARTGRNRSAPLPDQSRLCVSNPPPSVASLLRAARVSFVSLRLPGNWCP